MKQTVLVIEVVAATPHTETSIELAILESLSGSLVYYLPSYLYLVDPIWRSPVNGELTNSSTNESWLRYTAALLGNLARIVLADSTLPMEEILDQTNEQNYTSLQLDESVEKWALPDHFQQQSDELSSIDPYYSRIKISALTSLYLASRFIKQLNPDLIYCCNGRLPTAWPLYKLAQNLGIPMIFHERGSSENKYITLSHPPVVLAGWQNIIHSYSLRNELNARLGSTAFYKRKSAGISNNFGEYAIGTQDPSDLSLIGIQPTFAIFYTTSNHELMQTAHSDYWFNLGSSQQDVIASLVSACLRKGIQLVIRVHPGTHTYKSLFSIREKQVVGPDEFNQFHDGTSCIVIPAESRVCSYQLGASAQFRFTIGSTIGWELTHQGLAVGILGKSLGTGFKGVFDIKTQIELDNFLSNPPNSVDKSFSTLIGDFQNSFGEEYRFFEVLGTHRMRDKLPLYLKNR